MMCKPLLPQVSEETSGSFVSDQLRHEPVRRRGVEVAEVCGRERQVDVAHVFGGNDEEFCFHLKV